MDTQLEYKGWIVVDRGRFRYAASPEGKYIRIGRDRDEYREVKKALKEAVDREIANE